LNAKNAPPADYYNNRALLHGHKPKLSWVDVKTLGTENKHKLATVIGTSASGSKGLKKDKNASSCSSLHSENGITKMKSILKGSGKEFVIEEK